LVVDKSSKLILTFQGKLAGQIFEEDIYFYALFGPYRSHFLSRKSLIAAKNETKEERRKIGERDTTSACE
jgi:hypothetical protein